MTNWTTLQGINIKANIYYNSFRNLLNIYIFQSNLNPYNNPCIECNRNQIKKLNFTLWMKKKNPIVIISNAFLYNTENLNS